MPISADVRFVEVSRNLKAACENCDWTLPSEANPIDCRRHVIATGHVVNKTREIVTKYWLPE